MKLARLVSLGPPLLANTSNQTWVANVTDGGGEVQVVLKALSQREFFNELLASAIASDLSLPTPEVYLVAGPDNPILHSALLLPSGDRLCFGSKRAPYPAFTKALALTDPLPPLAKAALGRVLREWPGCGETIAFDTWLANVDRNAGNLLYEPNSRHMLIDHGRCFTGPTWRIGDLDPNLGVRNLLAGAVAQFVNGAQDKADIASRIIDFALRATTVRPAPYVHQLKADGWINDPEANAILNFLEQRVANITVQARSQAKV